MDILSEEIDISTDKISTGISKERNYMYKNNFSFEENYREFIRLKIIMY